jgi:hypothetical protein
MTNALSYIHDNRHRFVAELGRFIGYPSISAQRWHAGDVGKCAAWLADHLREVGLQDVRIVPTHRHPIVYASWRRIPESPTVLIYGHYDVQPPEPLEEWRSPPFEPIVRGDRIYGRGASDDKGQMFVHVKAIESYLKTAGGLPVNLICLFEGEEEIGSPKLRSFLIAQTHTLSRPSRNQTGTTRSCSAETARVLLCLPTGRRQRARRLPAPQPLSSRSMASGDNQLHRARVLEVRIHLPPAASQQPTAPGLRFGLGSAEPAECSLRIGMSVNSGGPD